MVLCCSANSRKDGELCVPKVLAKNYTMCDGKVLSGARINRCGVCWGGTTGRNESAGIHIPLLVEAPPKKIQIKKTT